MRTCTRCQKSKPLSEFYRKGERYQAVCKDCTREIHQAWYQARSADQKAEQRKKNAEARAAMVAFVAELKSGPCTDCGGTFHHAAMDFDHIGTDKEFNVSRAVQHGFAKQRILDEIAKCELVCANCHRIRTFNRHRALAECVGDDLQSR